MAIVCPKRRADGTFSVAVRFRAPEDVDPAALDEWLLACSESNAVWTREWRALDRVVEVDVLRWSDAFSTAPRLVTPEAGAIELRLHATREAVHWKDWMVRVIQAMTARYPSLTWEGIVQVD